MGVLSDLVVANEGDAEAIANSSVPSKEFNGIDVKGIDSIKLNTLHSILTGRSYEELIPSYEPVLMLSDDGPWVFALPHELTASLAALNSQELQAAAKKWAQTEEFVLDRWQVCDVVDVLGPICGEASKAVSSKQTLFLWMSL